jgi:hypothetical protein
MQLRLVSRLRVLDPPDLCSKSLFPSGLEALECGLFRHISIFIVLLYTMKSIKVVSFGTSTIQKLRRVALDPNLLTTLELQEGDTVRIDLDVASATILIRKGAGSNKPEVGVEKALA